MTNGSVVSPWVVGAVTGEVALSCGEVAMTGGEVSLSRGEVGMTGGEMLCYIVKLSLFVSLIFLKLYF